ncbi:MAG TPA: hypothetical protein VFU62_01510 [Hanamia sp.]|jgi:hypothetical protein|nr:hypothetical protein [Hanamia sp.]
MTKYSKIVSLLLLVCGVCVFAFADRGGFVKKNKTQLNIKTNGNLKNSIPFNLKSGLTYRGSFLTDQEQIGNALVSDAYISYKKGNTVYILPYKQKILIPEYTQQGGYKLIIRGRK